MPDEPHLDPPASPPAPVAPISWRERIELLSGNGGDTRNPWLMAAVALTAVIVGYWALVGGRSEPPELSLPVSGGPGDPAATSTTTTTVGDLLVHAAGAVRDPGVYRMPPAARVADLLEAAGGPADGADLDRLNLAAPLVDGSRVYVPRVGETVPPEFPIQDGGSDLAAGDGGRVIDVNHATQEELEQLPGIGPATARAILHERDRRGRFRSVEDLLEVRGIGPSKLDAIRDLVTVG